MSREGGLSARQRERQLERQVRRARRKTRRAVLQWIALAIIAIVALALVVGTMLPSLVPVGGATQAKALSAEDRAKGPGEHTVPVDKFWLPGERDYHLASEAVAYSSYASFPPTFGPHWPVPAAWGVYNEPVPNERQLHNLEHGGVTIQYKTEDQAVIENIKTLAQGLRGFPSCIVVAPYPTMEHPIALTAWGVILTLDEFDKKQIEEFAKFYRDQGPERLACQGAVLQP